MELKKQLRALDSKNNTGFVIYIIIVSFLTYSCMYAFRKPITVATFNDLYFLGIHYKIWLITSQILGYTLSKFLGIKLISEMTSGKRAVTILIAIAFSWLSLLLFAITPVPYNIIWLFFNGLPLGLIWGIVFSFLEGRRTTELLGAGLSISFIFASGFVKSTGKFLIDNMNVSEFWMPFLTGLIFSVPLVISVYFLNKIPEPGEQDTNYRTQRKPMSHADRKLFLRKFFFIIFPLTLAYIFLSVIRDIRDTFAAEIWDALGMGNDAAIFTLAEIPVGLGVLFFISMLIFLKNNLTALNLSIGLVIIGMAVNTLSTLMFESELISGYLWMVLVGFGLYLGYISFHAVIFERFIATFKTAGNIGFLFYIADSFGYLFSVSSFLLKNFLSPELSWLHFFSNVNYALSLGGIAVCIISLLIINKIYLPFPKTEICKI